MQSALTSPKYENYEPNFNIIANSTKINTHGNSERLSLVNQKECIKIIRNSNLTSYEKHFDIGKLDKKNYKKLYHFVER